MAEISISFEAITLPRQSQKPAAFDRHRTDVHTCDCVTTQMTLDARGKGMTLPLLMYWSPRKVGNRIDSVRAVPGVAQSTR